MLKIGLDVGSTTLKCVVLDEKQNIVFKSYERHFSQIHVKVKQLLQRIINEFPLQQSFEMCISGSAGMGIANQLDIPFVQEVYATRSAVLAFNCQTDCVIELGGEDAKILFLTDYDAQNPSDSRSSDLEVRMNGSCAGGTSAFIDQMAMLMSISADQMNELATEHEKIYTIASRCGVFAKSDIQPLLNQGAKKSDIAASIFAAVVNQTIAGLAQGRNISGNVLYLGGPLSFMSQLRAAFDKALMVNGLCPENSLYYVALGSALSSEAKSICLDDICRKIETLDTTNSYLCCDALFESNEEYQSFLQRHNNASVKKSKLEDYDGVCFVGIDAGSTTVKAVVISQDGEILKSVYLSNSGKAVPIIKDFLQDLYCCKPDIKIGCACCTGYGEEIVKNAFKIDYGIVETIAHFTAAKSFLPNVDFIIDIGGQDIKCFKIHNGAIDNIFLNEACSSGCGSFLQTFACALGYTVDEFSSLALFAQSPVDLGSRCTVFMNSSVKQAQKDGATVDNISAGLAISVVKNALYKVIRTSNAAELGQNIVVQGGTFLNNAVLRAFEKEIGKEVIRPDIAGLMGAYGAALYAKDKFIKENKQKSDILTKEGLECFTHTANAITCKGCTNHCRLTVNTFDNGRKFIGGNRCEKPLGLEKNQNADNMYEYKMSLLQGYSPNQNQSYSRGKIGIPMVLNMFELRPFWYTLLESLDFEVVFSDLSTKKLYLQGQGTIPSDTVCYPAKLVHGHIENLMSKGIDRIFYPCLTYNVDEHKGDNHYNCPVVAYYPEVIGANVKKLGQIKYYMPYLGIHKPKEFAYKFHEFITGVCSDITLAQTKAAVKRAYTEYENYMSKVRSMGQSMMKQALDEGRSVIVLCGRPYHLDPEVNHGIDKLITSLGATVVSEDSVCHTVSKFKVNVLNQWTYHARLYSSAKLVANKKLPLLNLVQLVSFGCGVDAITTDEVRSILEDKGKIYTQIKIDEITNLGTVKIRLRSLFSAVGD